MTCIRDKINLLFGILFTGFLFSCNPTGERNSYLFEALRSEQTGIEFENRLTPTPSFNMFNYMYFYNGAGVGVGDFNNDGLSDIFFSSNQGENKLYLNEGGLKFRDVTEEAGIPQDGGWSTGVSVVDINNDGLLDIYVCRVGYFSSLKGKNQFLIAKGVRENGVPFYEDAAKEMKLDFNGFGTQAAFFDYDLDGDLDMFLMNHSLRFNGTFSNRASFINTYDTLAADYLLRNDSGKFTDVSAASGIHRSVIGYGLGLSVADINLDGYPDLYIGNDFHENDYLYINQKDGSFIDVAEQSIRHTSQFSMGTDVADINNDGFPEIISMDMMPEDPYILKRSLGEDEYNLFHYKIKNGYMPQFARNTLQLNGGNGLFLDVGFYSNVFATDWSWAALWLDFDNDGLKDLFVSNGIPKRLNDMDYVNFVSNEELQNKIRENKVGEKDMALVNRFPEIKLHNKFFLNKGDVRFSDVASQIRYHIESFSNGSAYADFDNDGDLDLIVNNIDEPATLYKNLSNDGEEIKEFLQIKFKGPEKNRNAIGARVLVFDKNTVHTYEKFPVRGFQGSMEIPLHIGLHKIIPDSVILIWPDNTCERLPDLRNQTYTATYKTGLRKFNFNQLGSRGIPRIQVLDHSIESGIDFRHEENSFNEFDREPLIPFMTSREGPALAIGDLNNDGFEDVFIGSSKFKKAALFVQNKNGKFTKSVQPALDKDSTYEDTDAIWADVNNDGFMDLIVASGGNEYYGNSDFLRPRVYINNGNGELGKLDNAFEPSLMLTASSIVAKDFTGDGYPDLFIGGRAVPWAYGTIPQTYLLRNNGDGRFTDITPQIAPDLSSLGFVKHASLADLNGDKENDLVISLEWGGIVAFIHENGSLKKHDITKEKGWWNFTLPVDIDGDGDLDLIAGNLGWNSRLSASHDKPVRMYYNDFDDNGKKEQVLTYYLGGKEIPFANKDELMKQIPSLKKRFLYAEDFAKATLTEIFGSSKLKSGNLFEATEFSNAVFINQGNMNFDFQPLPWQAQLTPYRCAVATDINHDGFTDILLGGNFYPNNIQMGEYDADYGTLLLNTGKGNFTISSLQSIHFRGEVRSLKTIQSGGKKFFLLGKNDDYLKLLSIDFNKWGNKAW